MSHGTGEFHSGSTPAGELRFQSARAILSAFAVSLLVHASLVMVLLVWGLRGCGDGTMIATEGEGRLVGIYVKPSPNESNQQEHDSESSEMDQQPQTATVTLSSPAGAISDTPPVEIELPERSRQLGPGQAVPSFPDGALGNTVRPNAFQSSPSMRTQLGPGEVSFFNALDQGARIVFVIDTSSSMYGQPILVARAELAASIQALQSNQRFQVVFYDNAPRVLKLRGYQVGELYRAGDSVKSLARQELSTVTTQGSTNHKAALLRALKMNPEILYLLTDADSGLLPAEMDAIRRANRGKTRIHCIQFGEGANLTGDSFLKKLARKNGGTYQYRDLKKY